MKMYGFLFDGELSDDYGIIMANINSEENWTVGSPTYITSTTPSSDILHFYSSKFETMLSCEFSIIKNPCLNDGDIYFTQEEYSAIMRWLQREDGYKWLQFDVEEYEDVYFHAKLSLTPIYISGKVTGFNVKMDTDAPYAFSKPYIKKYNLSSGQKVTFENYSDKVGDIYPYTTLRPNITSSNAVTLSLITQLQNYQANTTTIKNVKSGDVITLDKDSDLVKGVGVLNNFNFVFPKISNSYSTRTNTLWVSGCSCEVTMQYRLIRMVTV